MGGFAAARLAIAHPRRVQLLILVNTGVFTSLNVFDRLFCYCLGFSMVARLVLPYLIPAYMKPQTASDTAILQKAVSRVRAWQGASIAAALWRSFLDDRYDLRSHAQSISAPTLIVWEIKDITFPVRLHILCKGRFQDPCLNCSRPAISPSFPNPTIFLM